MEKLLEVRPVEILETRPTGIKPGDLEDLVRVGDRELFVPAGSVTGAISYSAFRRLSPSEVDYIPSRTLVEDVKVGDLFTDQNWIEVDKAMRASLRDFVDGKCIRPAEAYPRIIRDRIALVVGDGTHKSGLILANGLGRIDVVFNTVPELIFGMAGIRSLPKLAREYWEVLRSLVSE